MCAITHTYTIPIENSDDYNLAAAQKTETAEKKMQAHACSCCAHLLLFGMIPFSSNWLSLSERIANQLPSLPS